MARGPAMAPAAGPGAVTGSGAAAAAEEMRWRQLDSGVSAVSFGFVATAILVSMFLAMAILEHFFRPPANAPGPATGVFRRLRLLVGRSGETGAPSGSDLEAARKLDSGALIEMPIYARDVSVVMPGQDVPTFIARPAPAPAPCPPERIQWPSHQPAASLIGPSSSSNPS